MSGTATIETDSSTATEGVALPIPEPTDSQRLEAALAASPGSSLGDSHASYLYGLATNGGEGFFAEQIHYQLRQAGADAQTLVQVIDASARCLAIVCENQPIDDKETFFHALRFAQLGPLLVNELSRQVEDLGAVSSFDPAQLSAHLTQTTHEVLLPQSVNLGLNHLQRSQWHEVAYEATRFAKALSDLAESGLTLASFKAAG